MTSQLSPQVLKCVVEYLEVTKRIHITSRSATLQQIEKSIPISIDRLQLNKHSLKLKKLTVKLCPKKTIKFEVDSQEIKIRKQLPEGMDQKESIKKLFEYYLGGRSDIYVDRVKFLTQSVTLPENLKLTVNGLDTHTHHVDPFLQYIDQSSFPLEMLKTVIEDTSAMQHPVVLSAEDLLIAVNENSRIKRLIEYQKIERSHICFKYYNLQPDNVVELIEDMRVNKKPVGTTFAFVDEDEECIFVLLELEKTFGEFKNELSHVYESFCPTLPKFLIPIDETSQIQVYGCRTNFDCENCEQLVIKVVGLEEEESDSDMEELDSEVEDEESEVEDDDSENQ